MSKTSLQLPGAICTQWVRCSNPNCRCARGELHGPYYYRFWHENGRLRKAYIRPGDVQSVTAACVAYHVQRQRDRADLRRARELLEQLRSKLERMGL